jgi:hypothetical protein
MNSQENQTRIIAQLSSEASLSSFLEQMDSDRNFSNIAYEKLLYPEKKIILLSYEPAYWTPDEIEAFLIRKESIIHVEHDEQVEIRNTPDDYWYYKQWDMEIIQAPDAWNVSTGGWTTDGDEIVAAVIDDGFYPDYADLKENIFVNNGDPYGDANGDGCPGNCGEDDDGDGLIDEDRNGFEPGHPQYDNTYMLDDDENGYKDDYRGLNLDTSNDSLAFRNHGTSVSSIIGAKGNNEIGVTGVNWDIKILPISSVTFQSEIIEAYAYVLDFRKRYNKSNGAKGAFVACTNFSAGIDFADASDYPLWCAMYDSLGMHGILSVGATTNKTANVDEEGDMPSTCPSPYLITVTNSDDQDQKVGNSGFGTTHIDLAAPGNGSWTVDLSEDEEYGPFGGTSAATPHVTGAVALLMSMPCPEFINIIKSDPSRVIELKDIILANVDQTDKLMDQTSSGGRLNIFSATEALRVYCEGSTSDQFGLQTIFPNPAREKIDIRYDTESYDKVSFEVFDVIGRKIYSSYFSPPFFGEKTLQIDISGYSQGIYFLSLKQGKLKSTKKVFVY